MQIYLAIDYVNFAFNEKNLFKKFQLHELKKFMLYMNLKINICEFKKTNFTYVLQNQIFKKFHNGHKNEEFEKAI